MNAVILKQFPLFMLAVVLGCSHAAAQILSPLHYLGLIYGELVFSGNTLYGTTFSPVGTVFAVNTDGTSFTNLYGFTGGNDGARPYCSLLLSGNTLYGTASSGGAGGCGTVFAVNTDGTGFPNLHSFSARSLNFLGIFTNSDGTAPIGGLVLSGNTLFGTASEGGRNGSGTVFAINTDGTGFTNLYNFTALDSGTNGDGAYIIAGLILSGNVLYGAAGAGGGSGAGTVFAVNTNGTGFATLHSFTTDYPPGGANSDGANPYAGLILSDNILYGTAYNGGYYGAGTVFAVNTDGTCFTNLHDFDWSDGARPGTGCISGHTLYGTTADYGPSGDNLGTVFAINTDGTGFATLYDFVDNYGEDTPTPGLILSGNTLYGKTAEAVFALSLGPIPLNVQASGQNQILAWGNPAFSLQSASALTGQWITLSNAASPYSVSATNAQSFFRLVYANSP